jgi:hypothetical protein
MTMSLYDRIISRPRPLLANLLISLLLLLAPVGAVIADGVWDEYLDWSRWRPMLTAPAVILYTLAISRWMASSEEKMLRAFRPVVQIDDQAYERLVRQAERINPTGEIIAIVLGMLAGIGISLPWLRGLDTFWLRLYVPVSLALMDGLLAWIIYGSITSTRLLSSLHRQPLKVDILDIKPFEPVGRYGLTFSLVFVGGIVLGMVFGLDVSNIRSWQSWAFYMPLLTIPIIVFFLNMRGTHRLLAAEKKHRLQVTAQKILEASRAIQQHLENDESLGELAQEYTALIAFETRLRFASTWPYNTSMLRTLFFTILLPLLMRGISALFFGQ